MLVAFCEAVDKKSIPQTDLTLQIRDRFDAILLGEKPADALELKKPTRVKSLATFEKQLSILRCYFEQSEKHPTLSKKQIYGQVAVKKNVTDATVKTIVTKYKGLKNILAVD